MDRQIKREKQSEILEGEYEKQKEGEIDRKVDNKIDRK
jgi:hypothetical protein